MKKIKREGTFKQKDLSTFAEGKDVLIIRRNK